MFKWKRKGLIFCPDDTHNWMNAYAQVPFTVIHDDFIRVYFSTREKMDPMGLFRSFSGYIDLDKNNLKNILSISKKPIIELGNSGEFDEFGSMAGSIIHHNNLFYLYFCGWTRGVSVPYNWAIGLATSRDGKTFKKLFKGPILGACQNEPYLQACPIVYKITDTQWYMFYLSGIKWFNDKNKKESQYLLMQAQSQNGIDWERNGKSIIPPVVEDECQTSASIIKIDDTYHMFFSYRYGSEFREIQHRGYRIGYASSNDLLSWKRDDKLAGIDVSDSGWDSEMVAYPHLFKLNGKIQMLYCGNYFGKDGFGYATLES